MNLRRREFLAMPFFLQAPLSTDARIEEVRVDFEDFLYRTPYKFGGREVDRVTVLNVHCRIRTKAGKSATGFASMPLGNVWSFPAPDIPYPTTLAAMKSLAQKIAQNTRDFTDFAHPLEANRALEPGLFRTGRRGGRRDAPAAHGAQALHPGHGQSLRRSPSRCFRARARPQQLHRVRPRLSCVTTSRIT